MTTSKKITHCGKSGRAAGFSMLFLTSPRGHLSWLKRKRKLKNLAVAWKLIFFKTKAQAKDLIKFILIKILCNPMNIFMHALFYLFPNMT